MTKEKPLIPPKVDKAPEDIEKCFVELAATVRPSEPTIDSSDVGKQMKQALTFVRTKISAAGFQPENITGFDFALKTVACHLVRSLDINRRKRNCQAPESTPFPIPKCGLIFMGKPGTGKTMLSELISKILERFPVYSASQIGREYEKAGLENVEQLFPRLKFGDCMIDDLHIDDNRKHFGNANIMDDILFDRYRLWKQYGQITIISTNIVEYSSPETHTGFLELYGNAITERVFEMCYPVFFRGMSKRKPAFEQFKTGYEEYFDL